MEQNNVKPAEGKLGIMVVGCGAVATTFMTGVFMARKGLAKPVGSMTQYDKIRVGKGADDRSETALHQGLTRLEVLACDRHLGLLCEFPHGWNINCGVRRTHDERSTLGKGSVGVAHGWSDVLAVVSLHRSLESSQCAVDFHVHRYVDFSRSSPDYNDACAAVLLLEVADVLAQRLYHLPAGLAVLHVSPPWCGSWLAHRERDRRGCPECW